MQHACRLAGFSRTGWYRASRAVDQSALRLRIRELAFTRPRFGASRICTLLRRKGWHVNRKRVHHLFRLEGLQVRMRVKRRKHLALHRGPVPIPTGRGQRWSMDFVHDALMSGRAFRVLTVVDQWSRESPLLEVGFSLTGQHVVGAFEDQIGEHGLPTSLTVDHDLHPLSRVGSRREDMRYRDGGAAASSDGLALPPAHTPAPRGLPRHTSPLLTIVGQHSIPMRHRAP